jgi:hypothetical protein
MQGMTPKRTVNLEQSPGWRCTYIHGVHGISDKLLNQPRLITHDIPVNQRPLGDSIR